MLRLVLGSLLLAAATSAPTGNPRPTMQSYGQNVGILLEHLEGSAQPPTAEQKTKVLDALRVLKAESHAIQPTIALMAVDPVMRYLSVDLSKQFARIEEYYRVGDYGISRRVLRETTQYCVGCHAASGHKSSAVPLFRDPDFKGSEWERAEFLTATRRYEEALLVYEKVLSDAGFRTKEPLRWERAAMNLLALTIRVREDAAITLEMISALLDQKGGLAQQTELLRTWRVSAKAWSLEPRPSSTKPSELLLQAKNLWEKGKVLSQQRPHFGLVEMLRAAMLLHTLTLSQADDRIKAEGFLLMGMISEEMRDLYVWMQPEVYYEAAQRLRTTP